MKAARIYLAAIKTLQSNPAYDCSPHQIHIETWRNRIMGDEKVDTFRTCQWLRGIMTFNSFFKFVIGQVHFAIAVESFQLRIAEHGLKNRTIVI